MPGRAATPPSATDAATMVMRTTVPSVLRPYRRPGVQASLDVVSLGQQASSTQQCACWRPSAASPSTVLFLQVWSVTGHDASLGQARNARALSFRGG